MLKDVDDQNLPGAYSALLKAKKLLSEQPHLHENMVLTSNVQPQNGAEANQPPLCAEDPIISVGQSGTVCVFDNSILYIQGLSTHWNLQPQMQTFH